MEILTGGRQNEKKIYNALKLYDSIDSLTNDTTVRVLKKDGICGLCVDKSISKQKVKDKIEELNEYYKKEIYPSLYQWSDITITEHYDEMIKLLQDLLGGK